MKKRIVVLCMIVLMTLVVSGCREQERMYYEKDKESREHGLDRKLTVYSIDGDEIYSYEGKFNFERDEQTLQYVDTKTKKKHAIFFGDNCVVVIEER